MAKHRMTRAEGRIKRAWMGRDNPLITCDRNRNLRMWFVHRLPVLTGEIW